MSTPSVSPAPGSSPTAVPGQVDAPVPTSSVQVAAPATVMPKPLDPKMGVYVESVPGSCDWHIVCG
jgi:hypothetical protein